MRSGKMHGSMQSPSRSACRTNRESLHGPDCLAFHPDGFGNIVPGVFTPVLAKHSKSLNLVDSISVGVDRMQRNFGPMQKQVESWQAMELSNVAAKMIVYETFIESELEVPKHLARRLHDMTCTSQQEDFQPRTMWSPSNAFTSTLKKLDPIPQFKATAKLGPYLERGLGS
jgi:hypothetical protein